MKNEKVVRYDRDKNKVFVTIDEEQEIKDGDEVVGNTVNRYVQEYEPAHVKKIYADLVSKRDQINKSLKVELPEMKLGYEYDELLELKKKLDAVQRLAKLEEHKNRREFMEKDLVRIKDDIRVLDKVVKSF